ERASLRVAQGNDATFRVGSRFPILNASFAPIFNTPALSRVIQNNSFQAAFPSFNYEDLGLSIKAKPMVNGSSDVSLQLELLFLCGEFCQLLEHVIGEGGYVGYFSSIDEQSRGTGNVHRFSQGDRMFDAAGGLRLGGACGNVATLDSALIG